MTSAPPDAAVESFDVRVVAPADRHPRTVDAGAMPDIEAALAAPRVLAPELDRVTFELHGVVTPSIARRIERRLRQLGGVIDARVDDVHHRLVVRLLPNQTDPAFIAALLDDDLLTAVPVQEHDPSAVRREAAHTAKRLTTATLRSLALLALAGIALVVAGLTDLFNEQARAVALNAQAIIATALVLWGARPTLVRAARRLDRGRPTPDLLPLGVSVSVYVVSLGVFFSGGQPAFFAAMLLITTTIVADWIGHTLRRRARAPLLAVRATVDTEAVVAQPGGFYTVRPQDLSVGDTIVVRAGQVVAADGMVVAGTGQATPPAFGGAAPDAGAVQTGADLSAGARIAEGCIALRVACPNPRSAVARIADVVEVVGEHKALAAGGRPSRDQRWFEARSAWAVVIVTASVLGAAVAALLTGVDGDGMMEGSWGRALAVLAAGAPLAAARLWDPALLCTVASALARGVLLRDLRAAYRLAKLRTLYLDRTGTLTAGRPAVQGWCIAADTDRETVLGLIMALEDRQSHPVARALYELASDAVSDVNAVPSVRLVDTIRGRGIRGRYTRDGESTVVRLGGMGFLRDEGIVLSDAPDGCPTPGDGDVGRPGLAADTSSDTVVYLAIDDAVVARFHLLDPIRTDARRAVKALEGHGVELGLFTGDSLASAQKAAQATGIPVAAADMDGDGLEAFIAARTAEGGDRVGAATSAAHVGQARRAAGTSIVLGTGVGAADYEDDVAVMRDDLASLADAIAMSRRTRWRVRFATALLGVYTAASSYAAVVGWLPFEAACVASLAVTAVINVVTSR